ncbi:MAG: tetratricopeptide repeat protein, partial [Bacteroidales bacterium]|nr:tetratricopeptide repeat protein [Bacteroidales bacterium]
MKKKTILLLMLFVEVVLYSQNTIEQAAQMNTFQLFSAAKHAERIGDWFSAITFYEAVLLNNETNKKAINHLAKLYFKTRDYNKALITYKKAQEIQAQNPENLFYIALLYKNIGDYEKSIEVFETFLKKSKQMKSAKRYKTIAKSSIEGSQYHLRNKNETSYFISI